LRTSYHVHTTLSDGRSEFDQYVSAAIDAGLDELGFSDHYALTVSGETPWWSLAPGALGEYLDKISAAAATAGPRIVVRKGVEVDFIPERLADIREALAAHQFDYLIGSVHFVGDFVVDGSPTPWEESSQEVHNEVCAEYWRLVRRMAETRLFDFVGHIDIVRKFGFRCTTDVKPLVGEALDAVREAGMAVELNTSGWHHPAGIAYPEEWILRECLLREIPTLINADAHEHAHVARDFDRAAAILKEIGYTKVVRFAGRSQTSVDL
jgi:histidinol-phosphatase (PHP family)